MPALPRSSLVRSISLLNIIALLLSLDLSSLLLRSHISIIIALALLDITVAWLATSNSSCLLRRGGGGIVGFLNRSDSTVAPGESPFGEGFLEVSVAVKV